MSLRDLIGLFRRRLWVLLLLPAFLTGVAAAITLYVLEQEYEASTTLWVADGEGSRLEHTNLLLNRDLARTFVEVMQSRTVAERAIAKAGMEEVTVKDLLEKMRVTTIGETAVIRVTVTDSDPTRAARLADAVVSALMDRVGERMSVQNLAVMDPAHVPDHPVRPNLWLNIAVAAVLGGVLAVVVVLLREHLNTSLRTREEAMRLTGLPVLAEVSRPRRKGSTFGGGAYRQLCCHLRAIIPQERTPAILVTGTVEEEGSSLTALHLATTFARSGQRVCLLDMSSHRRSSTALLKADGEQGRTVTAGQVENAENDPERTADRDPGQNEHVGRGSEALPEANAGPWEALRKSDVPGLWVVAAGGSPDVLGLLQALPGLRAQVDWVVVDAGGLLDVPEALVIAPSMDGVLLVARAGKTSSVRINRVRDDLRGVRAPLLGLVLTGASAG